MPRLAVPLSDGNAAAPAACTLNGTPCTAK